MSYHPLPDDWWWTRVRSWDRESPSFSHQEECEPHRGSPLPAPTGLLIWASISAFPDFCPFYWALENKLDRLCAEQLKPVGSKLRKSTLNTFVFFTLAALYYTSLQSAFIPFLVLFFFSFQRKGLLMVLFWGPRCVCVIKLLNRFLARTRVVGCCGDAPAQLSSCYQTTKIPNYHIFTRSIRSHTFGIRLPITGGLKRCNTWVLNKNIWYIF